VRGVAVFPHIHDRANLGRRIRTICTLTRRLPGCTALCPRPVQLRGFRGHRPPSIQVRTRYRVLSNTPEHAAIISQVLAIPPRRRERAIVSYLTPAETDALLAAPDRTAWHGRRDHALLLLAVQTGLRVSELTGLARQDAHLGAGPHVRCHGKGRKDRATPLTTPTVQRLKTRLAELAPGPGTPLFPARAGGRLSRDAVERLVAKPAATAESTCPSVKEKNVTPHTLRHTAAMALLRGGVDTSVIALWLGHEDAETTQVYLHADMSIKEQALARVQPPDTSPGRYRPPDTVLAFLDNL